MVRLSEIVKRFNEICMRLNVKSVIARVEQELRRKQTTPAPPLNEAHMGGFFMSGIPRSRGPEHFTTFQNPPSLRAERASYASGRAIQLSKFGVCPNLNDASQKAFLPHPSNHTGTLGIRRLWLELLSVADAKS